MTIARKNVLYVETRKGDTGKTLGLVALTLVVGIVGFYILAPSSSDQW